MKHRLFTILSALSLLLFVAVVVLWVRSYWMTVTRGGRAWDLYSVSGTLSFVTMRPYPAHRGLQLRSYPHGTPAGQQGEYVLAFVTPGTQRRWPGVEWTAGKGDLLESAPADSYAWKFPPPARPVAFAYIRAKHGHAIVAAVAALPAVPVTVRVLRRYRRRHRGLCPACGYDLRATPGREHHG